MPSSTIHGGQPNYFFRFCVLIIMGIIGYYIYDSYFGKTKYEENCPNDMFHNNINLLVQNVWNESSIGGTFCSGLNETDEVTARF